MKRRISRETYSGYGLGQLIACGSGKSVPDDSAWAVKRNKKGEIKAFKRLPGTFTELARKRRKEHYA